MERNQGSLQATERLPIFEQLQHAAHQEHPSTSLPAQDTNESIEHPHTRKTQQIAGPHDAVNADENVGGESVAGGSTLAHEGSTTTVFLTQEKAAKACRVNYRQPLAGINELTPSIQPLHAVGDVPEHWVPKEPGGKLLGSRNFNNHRPPAKSVHILAIQDLNERSPSPVTPASPLQISNEEPTKQCKSCQKQMYVSEFEGMNRSGYKQCLGCRNRSTARRTAAKKRKQNKKADSERATKRKASGDMEDMLPTKRTRGLLHNGLPSSTPFVNSTIATPVDEIGPELSNSVLNAKPATYEHANGHPMMSGADLRPQMRAQYASITIWVLRLWPNCLQDPHFFSLYQQIAIYIDMNDLYNFHIARANLKYYIWSIMLQVKIKSAEDAKDCKNKDDLWVFAKLADIWAIMCQVYEEVESRDIDAEEAGVALKVHAMVAALFFKNAPVYEACQEKVEEFLGRGKDE